MMFHINKMQLLRKTLKIALVVIPIWITIMTSIFIYHKLSTNIYLRNRQKSSTYLQSLIISGHPIMFDPEQDYYEISLNNDETSLAIEATPVDRSATVKIYNNDDLTKHDEVYIYVTSKNHDIRKYIISYNNKAAIAYFHNNIEHCTKIETDYCLKFFDLKSSTYDNFLLFSYDSLLADGYPKTNLININDKNVFSKSLINGEFHNFSIIDNKVIFTYNNQNETNKIALYGVDVDGNVILDKPIINNEYKNLYTYDFKISLDEINVKTRLTTLDQETLCKLPDDSLLEARYTLKYQDGNYSEPLLQNTLSLKEYKIIMGINC